MKTNILTQLIIFVVLISLFAGVLTSNLTEKVKKELNGYSNMLGKKVVYKKDTLQVVDYSILNSTVTLDNGTVINYDFAITLDTIPNGNK